jgi:hypothetical protein
MPVELFAPIVNAELNDRRLDSVVSPKARLASKHASKIIVTFFIETSSKLVCGKMNVVARLVPSPL